MPRRSAGILLFRRRADRIEVLLVHPGGPFWRHADAGAWSLPKGEVGSGEGEAAAARREMREETGLAVTADLLDLGEIRQKGGKRVRAWAAQQDWDPEHLVSNTIEVEWPPRSGRKQEVYEVDRAAWFSLDEARRRINPAQVLFLDRLARIPHG